MFEFEEYSETELSELLTAERAQMVAFAQSAQFCKGKARKDCLVAHDRAESMCLQILAEFAKRDLEV